MESKLLDLNSEKCCFLLAGSRKGKKKLQKEVDEKPLLLYNLPMKQVSAEKFSFPALSPTPWQPLLPRGSHSPAR